MKYSILIIILFSIVSCNQVDVNRQIEFGVEKFKQDSLIKALNAFNSVIAETDTSIITYFYRHQVYAEMSSYSEALADLESLESLDSGKAYIYANKGSLFYNQVRYPEALENFKKALEKDSTFHIMNNTISHMLFATGKKDEACEYYQKSIEKGFTDFNETIIEYCK